MRCLPLQIISVINVFMIVISIMTFGLKTSAELYVPQTKVTSIVPTNLSQNDSISNITSSVQTTIEMVPSPAFMYIDAVANAWFTLAILTRFTVSPDRSVHHSYSNFDRLFSKGDADISCIISIIVTNLAVHY